MISDIRKTRTCEKCKAVVPLDKVKLYPKNHDVNLLVCESCCENLKAGIRTDITGKNKTVINSPRFSALTSLSQVSIPKMKVELKSESDSSSQVSSRIQGSSKIKVDTPKVEPKKADHKKNISDRTISQLATPDYGKYRCIRCNYFFNVDHSKIGVTTRMCCPYCGRADKIEKANS